MPQLEFLSAHTVGDLCEVERPIYTIGKNQTVKSIFETLIKHNILSVPVYDNRAGKYKTFIDMLDILVYCVKQLGKDSLTAGYETFSSHEGFVATATELADASTRNPFIAVDKSISIGHAINRMNINGVHRIAAVDSDGSLQDLITQSLIIKFLTNHLDEIPFAAKTVDELQLGYRDVITVGQDKSCFFGFQTIVENKVSGVGVTDEDGKIIGNLSASDIKRLGYDNFLLSNVFLSLEKFLVLGKESNEIPKVLSVKPTDTFAKVLETLKETKVHRLYILDDDNTPKGVITLGDVLRLFD